jgi:amino acid transporter
VTTPHDAHSGDLRRELGLGDLVLAQIIFVVGGTWVGTAGKLGPAHAGYWLLAGAFFFVPHVLVVVFLQRWAPLEGGLYRWVKLAFGDLLGFLVAFDLWLYGVVLLASVGLDLVTILAYAIPSLSWMHGSAWVPLVATVIMIVALAALSLLGLRVGKQVHNVGGAVRLATYAILLALPIVSLVLAKPLRPEATRLARPDGSLDGLNILAKMGFGAFSGFEYVAIFAGESKSPVKGFARSVAIAAPIVLCMFVAGTSAVVAYGAPNDIDLIAPIPQTISLALGGRGAAQIVASIVNLAGCAMLIAWGSLTFDGLTRLPLVAGWDGLLPDWFTRLTPKSKVPRNATLVLAGSTLALAALFLVGVGHQEAYQLVANAALVFYALTYLVMFAVPLFGRGSDRPRAPISLRIACVCGFVMTAAFVVFALFPIVAVESTWRFAAKIGSVVVGAHVIGVVLYVARRRHGRVSRRDATSSSSRAR